MKTWAANSSVALLCAISLLTGCASLPTKAAVRTPRTPEPTQSYAERKRDAVAAFERQRDAAQVQAAINHWQRGDADKSLKMLTAIIKRVPSDVNARLRIAEIHTAQENFTAAETQLRECLVHSPDSAEVHHTLGMLLSEAPGREQEAEFHIRRAGELEPENQLYAAE